MKTKLLVVSLLTLLFAGLLGAGLNISRVAAATTLIIDPSSVTKSPGDVGTPFTVSVKVQDVADLYGFDIKITWDNTLITFASLDNTPLSIIWPGGIFEPLPLPGYQTGAGYVRYAAIDTPAVPGAPGFTGSGALFKITFNVVKACNFVLSTTIHFDAASKLSDSGGNQIVAPMTDGTYQMSATVPDLEFAVVDPTPSKPFEYCKTFQIKVYVTHICANLKDYNLVILYDALLLKLTGVDWTGGVLGGTSDGASYAESPPGTITVVDTGGIVWSGDPGLLFTLTFHIEFDDRLEHIWRNTSPHTLLAQILFGNAQLSFLEGTIPMSGIAMPSPQTITVNLIQGDVDCDGNVDVFDLRTVAAWFDQAVPPAPAKYDIKTTGNIDIFDLVLVAANFGYHNP
jgi:hypothetical protein